MIKTYILEDLDCAHCAGKIEEAVGKLDGVKKSTCTLLTQKLVVDIEDEKAASLTAEVKKIVKKYEPDVDLLCLCACFRRSLPGRGVAHSCRR